MHDSSKLQFSVMVQPGGDTSAKLLGELLTFGPLGPEIPLWEAGIGSSEVTTSADSGATATASMGTGPGTTDSSPWLPPPATPALPKALSRSSGASASPDTFRWIPDELAPDPVPPSCGTLLKTTSNKWSDVRSGDSAAQGCMVWDFGLQLSWPWLTLESTCFFPTPLPRPLPLCFPLPFRPLPPALNLALARASLAAFFFFVACAALLTWPTPQLWLTRWRTIV